MTGRARVAGLLLTIAATLGPAACSEPPAPPQEGGADVLRDVVAAERSRVYSGYKRTIHGEEGEGRATRMKVSRSASGRTLLEWDEGGGASRRWAYKSRFAWLDDPDLLLRNYSVSVDPADGPAVAWRETRHLTVRGVRPGRPTLDLYVDKETSLVLREELRDFEGRLWLTNAFDTIEYRAPDHLSEEPAAEPLADDRSAAGEAAALPLAVTSAPAGFVRVGSERTCRGALREDWTDGLAAFSIFERADAPPAEPAADGELQRRTCKGRASVTGVFSGIEVTVVGNLPVADLEAVVRTLAPPRSE